MPENCFMEPDRRPCSGTDAWMQIDCEALRRNLEIIHGLTRSRFMAVIKHNGYGLTLMEYAHWLVSQGVTNLAVGSPAEAIMLSEGGVNADILLLTPQIQPDVLTDMIRRGVMPTVGSLPELIAVRNARDAAGMDARIHLKIDTGLGRYGFSPQELVPVKDELGSLIVAGTYTHFASPYTQKRRTRRQFETFLSAADFLRHHGVETGLLHCCASGGLLNYPDMHLDMVRAGSAILGRVPGAEMYGFQPAVTMRAPIVAVKVLPAGSRIGYNGMVRVRTPTRIGILGAGPACGLTQPSPLRSLLGARQYALVHGQAVTVMGNLGSNSLAVNLTGVSCGEGDLVDLDVNPLYCALSLPRMFISNPYSLDARENIAVAADPFMCPDKC